MLSLKEVVSFGKRGGVGESGMKKCVSEAFFLTFLSLSLFHQLSLSLFHSLSDSSSSESGMGE